MRRLRAVLLIGVCVAVATSCSLITDRWGEDLQGATVQVRPAEVRVGSGDADVLGGTLFVFGSDLRVGEPSCNVVSAHLECPIPKMAPKKNYVLPVAGGNVVAQALVKREDGHFWARRIE